MVSIVPFACIQLFCREMKQQIGSYLNVSSQHVIITKVFSLQLYMSISIIFRRNPAIFDHLKSTLLQSICYTFCRNYHKLGVELSSFIKFRDVVQLRSRNDGLHFKFGPQNGSAPNFRWTQPKNRNYWSYILSVVLQAYMPWAKKRATNYSSRGFFVYAGNSDVIVYGWCVLE